MKIIWYGQSLFELIAKSRKNDEVKIVIDPFDESLGLKVPKLEANILLVSHDHYDHSNIKAVSGSPFLIEGPGEYEVKGVYIKGIPAFHDNSSGKERGRITIFTIETEELKICHLSDFGQAELTEQQLEEIGEVNVLMSPVGGVYTVGPKEASRIINQIEPQIIIPMHYRIPKLKEKLEELDKFLKVMGIKNQEYLNKLSIKKRDISEEKSKVIALKPN
jgi:L-ascorbate metabolism protein UlaG (beta-lactamase superfamily)